MKLKICGLSREGEVKAAAKADFVGFVVKTPLSHRNLNDLKFEKLCSVANNSTVAVTTTIDIDDLEYLSNKADYLQLHGNSRAYLNCFNNVIIGCTFEELPYYIKEKPELIVLDSSKLMGGTGGRWDWKEIPKQIQSKTLIAGGIDKENYQIAISKTKGMGIDLSSSLEIDNQKSIRKIKEIIEVVKNEIY